MNTTQAALPALPALPKPQSYGNEGFVFGEADVRAYGESCARAALSAAEAAQPEPVALTDEQAYHLGRGAYEVSVLPADPSREVRSFWQLTSIQQAGWVAKAVRFAQPAPIAAQAGTYRDSTPHLSVGESSFESWFAAYDPWGKGDKQRARDAYAAGMGDPLVVAAQAGPAQAPLTDEQIDRIKTSPECWEHVGQRIEFRHQPFARAVERAHGIGAQAPASTRPADASAHELAELVLAMDMVTPRGLVARQLARNILGVQGGDNLPPMTAIVTNGTLRILYRNEPVFLLRAQDELAARAVEFYAGLCAVEAPEVCQKALDHAKLMRAWPTKKLPDWPPTGGAAR